MRKSKRKIAIVTGTSRLDGIGYAICIELARRGFDISFTYWSKYDKNMPWKVGPNEPEIIQKKIKNIGVECIKLEIDLSKQKSIKKLFNHVNNKLGSPRVLINNATYSTQTNIKNLTAKELDNHYDINFKANTLLTLEFIKQFKYNKNGRIINLSSGQSLGKMPNEIAYAITKSAIDTLTYTLSSEIASKGITINSVNPGPNDTGWMTKSMKAKIIKQFPMKKIGTPTDTANLIGFLASKKANWITGQIIHSEGGFLR